VKILLSSPILGQTRKNTVPDAVFTHLKNTVLDGVLIHAPEITGCWIACIRPIKHASARYSRASFITISRRAPDITPNWGCPGLRLARIMDNKR
jgi:hypothetical protein